MKLEGNDWFYSKEVKKHFMKPQKFLKNENEIKNFNGYGKVGNMKCGDMMEFWIKVKNDKIIDVRWKTFGCASAIASTPCWQNANRKRNENRKSTNTNRN